MRKVAQLCTRKSFNNFKKFDMNTLKKHAAFVIFCTVLATLFLSACAQNSAQGSFGAGLTTVSEALKLRDDTPVVLQGRIEYRIRSEYYRFSDETGKIRVEISPKVWRNINVSPSDVVEITGVVDRHLFRRNKIEVTSIKILTTD